MTHFALRAIFVTACLALATAPAGAQAYDPSIGTGNIAPVYATTGQPSTNVGARSAYAQYTGARAARAGARAARVLMQMPTSRAFNAADPGDSAAGDPDPNIRFQLHRESLQGRW
jgi:hypothetical protein